MTNVTVVKKKSNSSLLENAIIVKKTDSSLLSNAAIVKKNSNTSLSRENLNIIIRNTTFYT